MAADDAATAPRASPRRSLKTNTAFGAGPRILIVAIALVQSPYIVSKVGLAAFGFWSVVLAVQAYAIVAGGGVPTVATRLITQSMARRDQDEVHAIVATTGIYEFGLGVCVVGLGAIAPLAVPHGIANGLPAGWALTTRLVAVSLALLMLSNAVAAVTRGCDRWGIDAAITTIGQIVGAVATFVLLAAGGRLPALALAACLTNGTMLVGYAVAGISLAGLSVGRARVDRKLIRSMLGQGRSLQIVGLVGATNAQADRFMLLPFASLKWIGAYALGSRVVFALRAFPLAAFGPLMVRAADVEASGGRAAVRALYRHTLTAITRYAVSLLIILYGATYAATLAWLGTSFTISAAVAVILGVGFALNIATGPGTAVAIACGRAELDRDYNLIGLGLNLALTAALGIIFGPWGVVVATTLGLVLSSAWLLRSVDRWLGEDFSRTVLLTRESLVIASGTVLISAAGILAARICVPTGRVAELAVAACTGFAGLALLVCVKWDYVARMTRDTIARYR